MPRLFSLLVALATGAAALQLGVRPAAAARAIAPLMDLKGPRFTLGGGLVDSSKLEKLKAEGEEAIDRRVKVEAAYAAYMTGARLNSPASLIKSVVVSLVQLAVAGGVAIAAASKAKVVLAAAAPRAVVAAAAILGAAFVVKKELAARQALIEAGESCILGDDGECQVYEAKVKKAPTWKLKLAGGDLVTNPPDGFEWGVTA